MDVTTHWDQSLNVAVPWPEQMEKNAEFNLDTE